MKVENPVDKIRLIRGVYSDMIERLKANNKALALNLFFGHAKIKYDPIFTALSSDLSVIAGQFGTLSSATVTDESAEIILTRMVGQTQSAFFIYILFGEDGIWRIESM